MRPDSCTPDERQRLAILDIFAADKRTCAAGLRVGVLNGIVHLAGVVESRAVRSAAEEMVRKLPGVLGVVNRIEAPGAPKPTRTINLDLKNK
jgi:osmotically-inducible protein OsmY